MIRRRLALLLAALMLASLGAAFPGGSALAEERLGWLPEHPVNPVTPPQIAERPLLRAAGRYFSIECTQEPALGSEGTWTVTPNEGVEAVMFRYQMCIVSRIEEGTTYLESLWYSVPSGDTFSYTCYQANTYYLYVYGLDENGSEILNANGQPKYRQYVTFVIEDDPEAASLDRAVQQIAAQCLAAVSGDYEIALWLHDWITGHSYYDYTYQRYAAEDILFGGCGVCDSYSKLYQRLLEACGLETVRITGGGHAWNAVNIDGSWCHIDTTWDDPGDAAQVLSGMETHDYFGINDEFMQMDHTYTPGALCVCDTLEYCYVYRQGIYHTWMHYALEDMGTKLAAGEHDFDADTQNKLAIRVAGDDVTYVVGGFAVRSLALGAALLNMEGGEWVLCERAAFPASFTYTSLTGYLHVTLDIDLAALDLYALTLPPGTTQVEEGAFEGACGFMKVILGDQVESIGPRAFADCAWLVGAVIPPSCVSIAEDAFDGVPAGLIVACAAGSAAEAFAIDHGLTVRLTGPAE